VISEKGLKSTHLHPTMNKLFIRRLAETSHICADHGELKQLMLQDALHGLAKA
jgi:hypothetical protein